MIIRIMLNQCQHRTSEWPLTHRSQASKGATFLSSLCSYSTSAMHQTPLTSSLGWVFTVPESMITFLMPRLGLALKPFENGLDRRANAGASIGLGDVQDLLLGLGQIGAIAAEHAVVAMRQGLADIALGIGHAAQHAEIDMDLVDERLECALDPGLRVLRPNLDLLATHEQPRVRQQSLSPQRQIALAAAVLLAFFADDPLDGRLLRHRTGLAHIFVRSLEHHQVADEADISVQDDGQ